uniref:Xanthine dehydrogenase n=1 Tax=Anopheles atroparvus TaxID=41427 RepID=A0A182JF08_ANOAO
LQEEGVHRFFSAADLTDEQNRLGPIVEDERVFARDVVTCQGQIIGAIVADDAARAKKASRKVKIAYEYLLPVIVTLEDAIARESYFRGSPLRLEFGDVDAAFKSAHTIVEGECRTGAQEHFYLEPIACIAYPRDSDEMEIISCSQHPAEAQRKVANTLGLTYNKVFSKVKRLGGGFGGKETKVDGVIVPVALAAYRLQRPVRCVLERTEDMASTGTRHPFLVRYRVAVDSSGLLLAGEYRAYSNAGYSHDLSFSVMQRAILHIQNAYKIPNVRIEGWVCRTNLPSCTAFRGFGSPQAMFIAETVIRHVAAELKRDPVSLMELNLYQEKGDVTHYNKLIESCTVRRCWDELLRSSDFANRRMKVDDFNRANRWHKRGIDVVPTMYGIAFNVPALDQSGALVHVYQDGTVLITHGGVEMGQGLHTKMIQVAASALQIPFDWIHCSDTATDKVPNTSATAASVGSDLNGAAVLDACKTILKRIEPYRNQHPDDGWITWIRLAYLDRVPLSATGFYATPNIDYNFSTNSGNPFHYYTFGAACSEVEIDCLTGDHQALRTDIVMDVGSSINPAIDIGQIEGGFMQGYGMFMLEEMIYSPTGEVYSRGPGTYKLPGFGNIAGELNVSLLTGAPNPRAVFSSKAIGEPPLFLAASLYFATKAAIVAARLEEGVEGYFNLVAPASAARIRMLCTDGNTKRVVDDCPDPECTLLAYLREKLRLCGTKLGCAEGGCGACTVMVSKVDRKMGQLQHLAVNACLTPVCAMHGMAVTTVEGIGSTRTRLHPVQERIAKAHGSQCGFCTPGIVMSMYALLRSSPVPSMKELEVAFQGNLCRCTGYRPILEGYKTFTKEFGNCVMGEKCCRNGNGTAGCGTSSEVDHELFQTSEFMPYDPSQEPIFPPELKLSDKLDTDSLVFRTTSTAWYRPTKLNDLLALKKRHTDTKIVVGNTEVGVEVKFKHFESPSMPIQSKSGSSRRSIIRLAV